jgi:hypothetical protein
MTQAKTEFSSRAALNASGQAIRLWGDYSLGANERKKIGWDESAALFDDKGYEVLINEIKGDGSFTLYILGTGETFDLSIENNWLMITVDAGK